jgi:DNA-binding LytR/AlgR family response regulator
VLTTSKAYMVLHRFGDALHELEDSDGLQVHRSWWVRKSAVTRLRQNAKKVCLVLESGEEIPVSGPYQLIVRNFVRSAQLPVTALTADS